jgi:hypothetical protein
MGGSALFTPSFQYQKLSTSLSPLTRLKTDEIHRISPSDSQGVSCRLENEVPLFLFGVSR